MSSTNGKVHKVEACRVCANAVLEPVLNLGDQMLTGVFPKTRDMNITRGPLRLVKCMGDNACGLVQLEHSYDLSEMYGENYGYRSGLNASMIAHLQAKVARIERSVELESSDLVIDIGSNDATTLKSYTPAYLQLVGVDPTGVKFRSYYPDHIKLISDFFSAALVREHFERKAKIVTSFSMFYDLERPMNFMQDVYNILADDGVWVFEQSYLPSMLRTNSYDTVCHEHLEFYSLHQIAWMAERVGFVIADIEFNNVNGGSFSVTARKRTDGASHSDEAVRVLRKEEAAGLHTLAPFHAFAQRVEASRAHLRDFLEQARAGGRSVAALGASTKGNVLLQYCGVTEREVYAIGEVNEDKFGALTPGSWIPIVPEHELLAENPDYILVLPWHFRDFFSGLPTLKGKRLVYPLPALAVTS